MKARFREDQMSGTLSRRKLLRRGGPALIAGGAADYATSVELTGLARGSPAQGVDDYRNLGVTTFINAAGTYTGLSASTMPDDVQAAMAQAAQQPVHLNELLDAAGEYLARRLRCEAALVTAGAAAALQRGRAAWRRVGT